MPDIPPAGVHRLVWYISLGPTGFELYLHKPPQLAAVISSPNHGLYILKCTSI